MTLSPYFGSDELLYYERGDEQNNMNVDNKNCEHNLSNKLSFNE